MTKQKVIAAERLHNRELNTKFELELENRLSLLGATMDEIETSHPSSCFEEEIWTHKNSPVFTKC